MAPSNTPTKLSKVEIMCAEAACKQKEMEEAIHAAEIEEAEERWREEEEASRRRYEEELQAVQECEAKRKAAAAAVNRGPTKDKGKCKDKEEVLLKPGVPKKKKAKKVVEESDKEVKVVKVAKGKSGAKKKAVEDEAQGSAGATKPCKQ